MNTALSSEKQFAIEVLDIFDELARPELKNRFMKAIWYGADWLKFGGVYGWIKNIITKKSDNEIAEKLLIIHKKLNTRFQDVNNSVEINKSEAMGSIPIPTVGQLYKIKNLTKVNKEQANQLMEELEF